MYLNFEGRKKTIDEIYENIVSAFVSSSHFYEFYDIYFKFSSKAIFFEVYYHLYVRNEKEIEKCHQKCVRF